MTVSSVTTKTSTPTRSRKKFVGHILVDVPAPDPAFRFTAIAQALADVVQASEPQFAVGILGGWGTGKSTLMDAISLRMDSRRVLVVPFNAWRYEREPHLMIPLLDAVRGGLDSWATAHTGKERATTLDVARRVGSVVRALTRGVSADIGLPGAFTLKVDPSAALDELSRLKGQPDATAREPQSLYHAAFQELAVAFGKLEEARLSRIVIFVDDLDRCLPMSALTVLESMKLFFDLPGFVFVVGLDERVITRAVAAKFATDGAPQPTNAAVLEREYLKKIFQVPYRLPAMATAQLDELLSWLNTHATMSEVQREDLRHRVRDYLVHVAEQGRINPREVKRFVNAYTLQRMIRPDLDPDVLLALQTIEFRSGWDEDWERLQEVVSSEPDVFVDTLRLYRSGTTEAFQNLWPQLGLISAQLSRFLLSSQASRLAETKDLEVYVTSLRQASNIPTWLHDAVRAVGELRQIVRELPEAASDGSSDHHAVAGKMADVLGRLESLRSMAPDQFGRLQQLLEDLRAAATAIGSTSPDPTTELDVTQWRETTSGAINKIQDELRFIRQDLFIRQDYAFPS